MKITLSAASLFGDNGQFAVHGEDAEGSHEHAKGTWTLAGDKVTLDGKWDSGKDARWTGTLAGGVMTIDTEPGKPARRFRRN